jgi:hypothetical protein
MSVHRRRDAGRWVVRWRSEGRQRSRAFQTRREAEAFDREMRDAARRNRDRDLAADLLGRDRESLAGAAGIARGIRDTFGRVEAEASTWRDEQDRSEFFEDLAGRGRALADWLLDAVEAGR